MNSSIKFIFIVALALSPLATSAGSEKPQYKFVGVGAVVKALIVACDNKDDVSEIARTFRNNGFDAYSRAYERSVDTASCKKYLRPFLVVDIEDTVMGYCGGTKIFEIAFIDTKQEVRFSVAVGFRKDTLDYNFFRTCFPAVKYEA